MDTRLKLKPRVCMKFNYYASLANEILTLNRQKVQLVGCKPEMISGFGFDSAIRLILNKILPTDIHVARGWVMNTEACSSYSDIIIYDNSSPTLFQDGNEVIMLPAACQAMIRVVREVENGEQLSEIWEEWTRHLPGEVEFHALLICHSGIKDLSVIEGLFESSPISLNILSRGIFMLGQEDVFSFYIEEDDSEEASIQLEHIQIWLPDCEHPALSYVIFELLNSLEISDLYPAFDQLPPEENDEAGMEESIAKPVEGNIDARIKGNLDDTIVLEAENDISHQDKDVEQSAKSEIQLEAESETEAEVDVEAEVPSEDEAEIEGKQELTKEEGEELSDEEKIEDDSEKEAENSVMPENLEEVQPEEDKVAVSELLDKPVEEAGDEVTAAADDELNNEETEKEKLQVEEEIGRRISRRRFWRNKRGDFRIYSRN